MMKRVLSSQMVSVGWRRQHEAVFSIHHPALQQHRLFASRRKTPQKKKKKKSPPKANKKLPKEVFHADSVPPAYLSATASPFCYVATCAVQEANMDPKTLFTGEEDSLPFFHASYISPKEFQHKLPDWNIPEVAFLGRSNVGKSSLVNALLNNKNLAKCSKQPGRTQQVNYFGMYYSSDYKSPAEAVGYFIDLPGYGFAKAPLEKVHDWQETTQEFLLNRRNANVLRRLFLLVDARRGTSQIDRDIMGWLDEAAIAYSVVLTKADRVGRPQLVRFCNDVCMRHHSQMYGECEGSQGPVVHVTSARDGHGIAELLTAINAEFIGHREEAAVVQQQQKEGWSGKEHEYVEEEDTVDERDDDLTR